MFCPRCKAEYREGFSRCAECDVELVDNLPADAVEDDVFYVAVATAQGPREEGQITSFLEGHGIPAQVRGEGVRKVYGFTLNGLGASQILVPRNLAAAAVDLLERADRGELQIPAADE